MKSTIPLSFTRELLTAFPTRSGGGEQVLLVAFQKKSLDGSFLQAQTRARQKEKNRSYE
ncbi:MAG: hypothetical protein ABSC01_12920 [Verrucomicrobiota bacterium]|jgi:hypothetical protein